MKKRAIPAGRSLPVLGEEYHRLVDGRDEWVLDRSTVSPGWAGIARSLNRMGSEELGKRQADARRLLRENGVTYTVYADPNGRNRTWELDPVPMVIDAADWAVLEAGLKQRAELLNLLLADIYGARRVIKQGVIPAELVYLNPGFLRACDAVRISGQQQLLMYGADLARGQDGSMRVYADRTQVPTGAGYALENRMVMSRIMPEDLRDNQVQRLSNFFRQFAASLQKFSQHRREDPYVVVLTPGPGNETYFEHAYFATYMGYPLVQGGDLLVRDNRVWLKSIEGLKQVDVILRRVDDSYCDPLELREDSMLGVPGLLNVARAGHVVLANPLGSGVMECRALMPFLDVCSRYFLGEDLQLSSVATWWCGQPAELSHVLSNIDRLVIKNAFNGGVSWFGPGLSKVQREELIARIQAAPAHFVGQECVRFSTAPALVGAGRIEPRHMMFRGFLFADGKHYRAMPGGLTRVARDAEGMFISNQRGGVSKDTWVLLPEHSKPSRSLTQTEALVHYPHESRLPSRAAENLFWVGRYAERAECVGRLMRVAIDKVGDCEDFSDATDVDVLRRLLESLTVITSSYPGFLGDSAPQMLNAPQREILSLARQRDRRGSLPEIIGCFMNAAYGIRDLWFGDAWRSIGAIAKAAEGLQTRSARLFSVHGCVDKVVHSLMAFSGITAESMRHDHAWNLLDLGRRIERAVQQSLLLEQCLVQPLQDDAEHLLVDAMLLCSESLMAQRRRFRYSNQLFSALDLLVLDERHARSLAYQVDRIGKRVRGLPRHHLNEHGVAERFSDSEKRVIEMSSLLGLASVQQLVSTEADGVRIHLRSLLQDLRHSLWNLSTCVTDTYFSHTPRATQLLPSVVLPSTRLAGV